MPARGFAMLYVSVDLTEEGINHVDDIVHMIFSYIRLLKKEKPLKWIFEVIKKLEIIFTDWLSVTNIN